MNAACTCSPGTRTPECSRSGAAVSLLWRPTSHATAPGPRVCISVREQPRGRGSVLSGAFRARPSHCRATGSRAWRALVEGASCAGLPVHLGEMGVSHFRRRPWPLTLRRMAAAEYVTECFWPGVREREQRALDDSVHSDSAGQAGPLPRLASHTRGRGRAVLVGRRRGGGAPCRRAGNDPVRAHPRGGPVAAVARRQPSERSST